MLHIKTLKVTSLSRAAFSYSAVQPSFDVNFPLSSIYIRKLAFGSPWGNYFTPGFVCNIRRPVASNVHSHRPHRVPIHFLVEWSLGNVYFFCPEKFTLGQCRTTDISICSRTLYNRTNAPIVSMRITYAIKYTLQLFKQVI